MNNNSTVLVSTFQLWKQVVFLLGFMIALPVLAQKGDKGGDDLAARASELFEEGKFATAYPLYSQLLSLKPNDPDFNFKFGATSLYAGVPKETALKHLNYALKKNCSDVRIWFYLGKAHHLNYDFGAAASAYRSYLEKLDPKEKNILPAQRNLEMCEQGGKLLSNVRDVVVLEKTEAAESDFFRYYNLEEIGGRVLRTPDELLSKYDKKVGLVSVMHYPGDATTIYFTSYGKDGSTGKDIYKADILPGGNYSTPERLPDGINTAEDEDFAFMHSDGKSFYFASRGHNSMGGYDIFRSDYNRMTGSFGPPVNLDFAINTPDDDLFYVVDSVKQTAYFASGRTSAQGSLHVYKVMVESLPLQLIFIAGDYIPEAEGLSEEARIVLIDELTGRTIAETTAHSTRGGYFLELPKSGNYRIEVQAVGGAVRHSGVFTVPLYDESVALKQELRIVNENGIERLIITNSFDEPLDTDLAQLAAESLRRRSALDPNATDDRIEAARERQQEGSLREEVSAESIVQEAGFAPGETLDSVIAQAEQGRNEQEAQSQRFEANAGAYLNQALAAQREANEKMAEAKAVIDSAAESEGAAYMAAVDRYNALLNEADEASQKAKNLLASAERLSDAASQLRTESEAQASTIDKLRGHVDSENWSAAKEVLIELRTAEDSSPNPAEIEIKKQLEEADRRVQLTGKRTENQTAEMEVLTLKTQQLQRELDAATKKSERERLSEELAQSQSELAALTVSVEESTAKEVQLRQEAQALRNQLKLVQTASTADPAANDQGAWSKDAADALLAEIEAGQASLQQMEDTTGESVSAVTNSESRRSFNVELLPTIAAQMSESEIELIPLNVRTSSYSDQLASIQSNPSTAPYKQRALDELQLAQLNDHLTQLKELELIELPEEERIALEIELKATQDRIRELNAELLASANTPDTAAGRQLLDQRFPEYAELRTAEKGNDLEQTLRRVERAEAIEKSLRVQQLELRTQMLQSTAIDAIDALDLELLSIDNIIAVIHQDLQPNRIQAAWENDRLAIIEEDENFESRTLRQIELTETYIATLDRLETAALRKGDNDEAADYAQRRAQAELKLNEQRSERELALTVSEAQAVQESDDVSAVDEAVAENLSDSELASNDAVDNRAAQSPATEAAAEMDEAGSDEEDLASEEVDSTANPRDAASTSDVTDAANETAPGESALLNENALTSNEAVRLNQIQELQRRIDATSDESLKDLLMADIGVLNTPLEPGEILVSEPIVESAPAGSERDEQRIAALNKRMDRIDGYLDAQELIEGLDDLIEGIDADLATTESKVRRKNLTVERNGLMNERGEAQVARSNAAAVANKQSYSERRKQVQNSIDAIEVQQANGESLNRLLAHFSEEQQRAEDAMRRADALRSDNLKTRNPVEKGQAYQDALLFELEALEIQNRLLKLGSVADALVMADAEVIDRVTRGSPVILSPAVEDQDIAERTASDSVNNSTEDDRAVQEELQVEIDSDTTIPVDSNSAEGDSDLAAIEMEATDESIDAEVFVDTEATDAASSEPIALDEATVTARQAIVRELRASVNLPDVQPVETALPEPLVQTPDNDEYQATLAELDQAITVRNAIVNDLNSLTTRIETLEQAVVNASTEAESEGLVSELSVLYRAAEIRYTELAEADVKLESVQSKFTERTEALAQQSGEAVAESFAEVDSNEPRSTAPVEDTADNPSSGLLAEEGRESSSKTLKPDYYFILPEVIVESFFEVNDASVYSETKPIPVDAPMPEGLVYKVQVGAYRKPIPQDLFKGFAPLRGEKLDNGITRYTAGVFVGFEDADNAKLSIRQLGYRDAFVVAYYNGQRISLTEARRRGAEQGLDFSRAAGEGLAENPSSVSVASAPEPRTPESSATVVNAAATGLAAVPEFAANWRSENGVWITVQVGVYSRPVSLGDLFNIENVMAEPLDDRRIRYTSGKYSSLESALQARNAARQAGIADAFLTAYIDGRRVPVDQATALLGAGRSGQSASTTTAQPAATSTSVNAPAGYRLRIGAFDGQVPAATVTALLTLESVWGIEQEQEADGIVFYSRMLQSRQEAESALNAFFEMGVVSVTIVEVTP